MKNNHKILVMMVTSALMTCPVWASETTNADTTQATTQTTLTGYEPAGMENTPVVTTVQTPAATPAKTVAPATPAATAPAAPTFSGATGYEPAGSENVPVAATQPVTATTAAPAVTEAPAATTDAGGATGYEPAGSENQPVATTAPAETTETAQAAPAAPVSTMPPEPSPLQITPLGGNNAIDTTTFPKYPMASLTAAEESTLPYGSAVADGDVQPYAGKTAASVRITPLPEQGIATKIQPRLAMREGDAINIDYIRHDVNVIGGIGLFSTVTPVFQNIPEGIALDYQVKMNPVVNKVDITGNNFYKTDDLLKLVNITPGSVLNNIQAGQAISAINNKYSSAGYILSRVTSSRLDEAGVLHLGISEGHLEDVIVKGNTKTKTKVITRELIIKKGALFNKDLARRSVERVYNTGFFEDVNVRLLPGQLNKNDVIMEIDVTEQKTGSITIGAGYSDSDGLVGILGLSETNFRGRGDQISINWEFGGTTDSNKNYVFSYTHPWMNDHGDSIGFSIFDRESDYDDYNGKGDSVAEYYKRTRGGNVTYGRVRSEYVKDFITLESKSTKYTTYKGGYNYEENNSKYAFKDMDYIGKNFGRTNSMTWSHVFDNRDNVYDPTRGKRLAFTGVVAGHGLGGDFSYYKLISELRTYYKVGRSQVVAFRLMGGMGFGDMPFTDLFSLGGADTLRGYEDDEFRGSRMYEATLEYRFPIVKKVQGVLFTDAGNAWGGLGNVPWYEENNKLHWAVGAGVRITTPIGPVRLDYGHGADGGKFHFSFGGKF